jgi:hypothetical protein
MLVGSSHRHLASGSFENITLSNEQFCSDSPLRRALQILLALSDSHNVIAAITKYQASLASGTGLPIDDTPRIELMAANLKVVEKIRTEIRALEHELDRQEGAEKSRV